MTVELVPKQRIPRAAFWAALGNTRTLSQSQKDDNRRQAYDNEVPISSLYSGSLLRAAQLESHCLPPALLFVGAPSPSVSQQQRNTPLTKARSRLI